MCNHCPIVIEKSDKYGQKVYVKWCYKCNQEVSPAIPTRLYDPTLTEPEVQKQADRSPIESHIYSAYRY